MVLEAVGSAKHNRMLGQWLKHSKSTNSSGSERNDERPAKRLRVETGCTPLTSKRAAKEIADSEAETDDEEVEAPQDHHRTDLETALPLVRIDDEAIQEYETHKAADDNGNTGSSEEPKEGGWIRGRSSIYVDAFNMALDTVLEEEAHLFDEAETAVFKEWRRLSYEAQYLFVLAHRLDFYSSIFSCY